MPQLPAEQWLLAACDPQGLLPAPKVPLALFDLPELLTQAEAHAVAGAVLAALDRWHWSDALTLSQQSVVHKLCERTSRRHTLAVGRTLALQCLAKTITTALVQAGIATTILKGPDFAERLYPSAALRPCRDIDLLVPRKSFSDADRMLQSLGFAPVTPERKYAAEDYGQISYFSAGPMQWSVELHWSLINSPTQRGACTFTWDDLDFLPNTNTAAPHLLAPISLLVLTAVHACIGHRFDSLQQLCDLRQLCRGAAGAIDPHELGETCQRLSCVTAMRWSLDLAARLFGCEAARELASLRALQSAKPSWRLIGPQMVLRPETLASRVRRNWARRVLKTAA